MSQRGATVQVTCANKRCGVEFTARVADRKRGWAKYCSKSCKAVVQEKRTEQYASYLHRERVDRGDEMPTFNDAHSFDNVEHDCNKD